MDVATTLFYRSYVFKASKQRRIDVPLTFMMQ